MLRILLMVTCAGLCGCSAQIEVQSNTRWSGLVNQGDVEGTGYRTFDLWRSAPSFYFSKETPEGYLRVRFKKGFGDEPETTAPYGSIWGSAW